MWLIIGDHNKFWPSCIRPFGFLASKNFYVIWFSNIWIWVKPNAGYSRYVSWYLRLYLYNTSVDTEMCCLKCKYGCQYFKLLTLKKKKNSWTQGSWIFFNKKLILDCYFCLKSGPVFLFQIFIIAPLPLPRDIKLYH